MKHRAAFVYSPAYAAYSFGTEHPFNARRLELTVDLLQSMGLLYPSDVEEPRPATPEQLELKHSKQYVATVEASSRTGRPVPGAAEYGLGTEDNPVFPGMHEAASLIVGGTLTAAELVASGRYTHALSIGGGLHHAGADTASGFCIYNDIAVAIEHLKRSYGVRVAYIDTDAHHGDGVQWLFYSDPEVLTVSVHETGRYLFPGTGYVEERGAGAGYGYSVNVPLEAFTEDDSFIEALEKVLPPVLEDFRPDIIVSQHGCDGHRLDPLTDLCLSIRSYALVPRLIHELAHALCDGRWVAVGGGGYNIWSVVPRAWAYLWASMAERSVPEVIPHNWSAKWAPRSPVPLPQRVTDEGFPPVRRRREIEEKNRITVARVLGGLVRRRQG